MFTVKIKPYKPSGDVLLFAMPATALTGSLIVGDYDGTRQFAKGCQQPSFDYRSYILNEKEQTLY